MLKIIPTTKLQQRIGMISASMAENITFIVTNRGEARIVMLPYFEGCDDNIQEYLEDFEMVKNRENLKKRYKKSAQSGKSSTTL